MISFIDKIFKNLFRNKDNIVYNTMLADIFYNYIIYIDDDPNFVILNVIQKKKSINHIFDYMVDFKRPRKENEIFLNVLTDLKNKSFK